MHTQPTQNLGGLIRGHLLMAVVLISGFYLLTIGRGSAGSAISSCKAEVESKSPDLLLVGNSILRAAIDPELFSSLSGINTVTATSNGSSSLWWYLYTKNVATKTRHKPRYVGIMFRDTFLTEPAYRVTGSYQKPIRLLMTEKESLVQKLSFSGMYLDDINSPITWAPREARNWLNLKIEKRTENVLNTKRGYGRPAIKATFAPEKMRQTTYDEFQLEYEDITTLPSYDFHTQLDKSYLPHILKLLKERGIIPVFIRAKRRRDLDEPGGQEDVRKYIAQLKTYLNNNGAIYIDFSQEQRITEAHFGPGDHLNNTIGKKLFMQLFLNEIQLRVAQDPSVIR